MKDADISVDEEKARTHRLYEMRAKEGENVTFANCPVCGHELAIYFSPPQETTHTAVEPKPEG